MLILSSSRFISRAQYPSGCHMDGMCMYIFIVMTVHGSMSVSIYICSIYKKGIMRTGEIISLSFPCLLPTGAFSLRYVSTFLQILLPSGNRFVHKINMCKRVILYVQEIIQNI